MQRELAYLEDIAEHAERIASYTRGQNKEDFSADQRTLDAVVRCFEVIGEAAKRVSDETLERIPGIDWKGFKGFRDVLIHGYDDVDTEVVWDSVTHEVPELAARVREFLRQTDSP